jgi:hypothetical protein
METTVRWTAGRRKHVLCFQPPEKTRVHSVLERRKWANALTRSRAS